MNALASDATKSAARIAGRGPIAVSAVAHQLLRLGGFAATNILVTWGLLVLFFLILGGLSLGGLIHQLHNLTVRYIAADADRITAFRQVAVTAQLLLFAGVALVRRHSILPRRGTRGSRRG